MLIEFSKLAFAKTKHDGLMESAQVELKAGWFRFGLALLMSLALVEAAGLTIALCWLGVTFVIEAAAYFLVRIFVGAGGGMWRLIYFINSVLVSCSWTAYAALIWFGGGEAARLAAVAGLFALSLYAVMVCHHDARLLICLFVPPCVTLIALLIQHASTTDENLLLLLQPALGFVGVLAVTGWLCHANYHRLADAQENLSRERNLLERRVAERTAALEGALVRAEAAHAVKAQFLANMSHELRTPLNAIINYSEIVQEDLAESGDVSARDDVKRIHAAGQNLLALITDLLDASRIEAGAMMAECAMSDVGALMNEVAAIVRPLVEKGGNTLEVRLDPDLGDIWTDAKVVRQCTLNLLSNACKFTHDGQIVLEARREGGGLAISVTDTGIGIAATQLASLFQPFVQGDNSMTRSFGGAGLGLVITRRLTELLDGSVTCQSKLGEGATFVLRLPLMKPAVAALAA